MVQKHTISLVLLLSIDGISSFGTSPISSIESIPSSWSSRSTIHHVSSSSSSWPDKWRRSLRHGRITNFSRRRRWMSSSSLGGSSDEANGRKGKPARSSEEDIKLTREVIMKHIESCNDDSVGLIGNDDEDTDITTSTATATTTNKLDNILSKLTSGFPFFVLSSAILALYKPSTLKWVNNGELISLMLASVMMGTGMTLEKKDFSKVLTQNFSSVPTGVLCQYTIMPLTALFLGRTLLLPSHPTSGAPLFLGLVLVGCSPGGTASNLVSLIAGADVALSVLLTAASTILAAGVTPLLVQLLVGSTVSISGAALCTATARVVLLPVLLGMILNARAPTLSRVLSRFTPLASVILVALICGGVVAQNAAVVLGTGGAAGAGVLLSRIVWSVGLLHAVGFGVGFFVPRCGLGFSERTSRTISIETGMQNSALAVVLARSVGADALAGLPGALSATAHSCLGSILAAFWRMRDAKNGVSDDGD